MTENPSESTKRRDELAAMMLPQLVKEYIAEYDIVDVPRAAAADSVQFAELIIAYADGKIDEYDKKYGMEHDE